MSRTFTSYKKEVKSIFGSTDLYHVPLYQRSFSWDKEQIDDFWYDLVNAMDEDKQYYLGATVFIPNEDGRIRRCEIVDGQQRFATLQILFAVVRNLTEAGDISPPRITQDKMNELLYHVNLENGTTYQRLSLNYEDGTYFSQYILDSSATDTDRRNHANKDSEKRILFAYDFLTKRIVEWKTKNDDLWVTKLLRFVMERVVFVVIEANSRYYAYQIFETINARGSDLTPLDLIKNLLLSSISSLGESEVNNAAMIWKGILSKLENEMVSAKFVRYYWMSKHGFVRMNNLYRIVNKLVTSSTEAKAMLQSLEIESEIYKSITEPDTLNNEATEPLKDIKHLRVTQVHPLLLSVGSRFGVQSEEFQKLSKALISFIMRFFFISGNSPNSFEQKASELAIKARDSTNSIDYIIEQLRNLAPNDSAFEKIFAEARDPMTRVPKFILRKINDFIVHTDEIEISSKATLEHILPKTATPSWLRIFSADEYNYWLYRLGNLSLLDEGLNSIVGNNDFDIKSNGYKDSLIQITTNLLEHDEWNKVKIMERQKKFAEYAVQIWPL